MTTQEPAKTGGRSEFVEDLEGLNFEIFDGERTVEHHSRVDRLGLIQRHAATSSR